MKTRQELVEVIGRAIWENMKQPDSCVRDVCWSWPCGCAIDHAKVVLVAIEESNARVVPEVATDEMIEAEHQFLSKGSFLSHPNVRKYRGPSGGDSPEIWEKDYARARISSTINASPFKG